jgi:hypothetical protein
MDFFTSRHTRPFKPAFVTEALDRFNKASERRAEFVAKALTEAAKQRQLLLKLDYTGQLDAEVSVAVGGMRKEFEGKMSLLDELMRDATRKAEEREYSEEELVTVKRMRAECSFFKDTIAYLSQIHSNLLQENTQLKKKVQLFSTHITSTKQALRRINMDNIHLSTLIHDSQPTSYSLSPKHKQVACKAPSLSVTPAAKRFHLLQDFVTERRKSIRRCRHKTCAERKNLTLNVQRSGELRALFKECVRALPELGRLASEHKEALRSQVKRNRLSHSLQRERSKQQEVSLSSTEVLAMLRASSSLQASLLSATLC